MKCLCENQRNSVRDPIPLLDRNQPLEIRQFKHLPRRIKTLMFIWNLCQFHVNQSICRNQHNPSRDPVRSWPAILNGNKELGWDARMRFKAKSYINYYIFRTRLLSGWGKVLERLKRLDFICILNLEAVLLSSLPIHVDSIEW